MLFTIRNFNIRIAYKYIFSKIRHTHRSAFIHFYENNTGNKLIDAQVENWNRRYPKLKLLTEEQICIMLNVLEKFNINNDEALKNPQLFNMNIFQTKNYGCVLAECGFLNITPNYLIRYKSFVRTKTIAELKNTGCLAESMNVAKNLKRYIDLWPETHVVNDEICDNKETLVQVRSRVIQSYLEWRLDMSAEEFEKFNKTYKAVHKPMAGIQESLYLAETEILLTRDSIKRNPFIIATDSTNIKLLLRKVEKIAGLDTRYVLRMTPAILKNDFNSILRITELLEEYGFSDESQQRCLWIFCMHSDTVEQRLCELQDVPEFLEYKDHPRALYMVVYKDRMMKRLSKVKSKEGHSYTFDHIVSTRKKFDVI